MERLIEGPVRWLRITDDQVPVVNLMVLEFTNLSFTIRTQDR